MERPHILILRDATLGRTLSRTARTVLPGVYLISALLLVTGCANHSLVPAAQEDAIKDRERALATRSDALQAAIRQSGKVGALAFLDTNDGHLVVLPGDSPADAWARSVTSPEGGTDPASMPPVVTFVYRADIPKAPEAVTLSALQQQQVQRTSVDSLTVELKRLDEKLNALQRELATTKQDTDKAAADVRTLAEDLASVRKFMLQTAQLSWLNQELAQENANGIRRLTTATQELTASSAKLEETVRQLSEGLSGQLKELSGRLDTIQNKIQNIK
jgi:DNA repair exonuclease SbcCD ATPase subunit